MRQLNEFGDECKAIYFIRDQQTMRVSQLESKQNSLVIYRVNEQAR